MFFRRLCSFYSRLVTLLVYNRHQRSIIKSHTVNKMPNERRVSRRYKIILKSMKFHVRDFKQERLTPSLAIYNGSIRLWLASVPQRIYTEVQFHANR